MRLLYYPSIPDTLSPDEDDIRAGVRSFLLLHCPFLYTDPRCKKTGSQ